MVGWGQDNGKETASLGDRMTDYLLEMRRQRQAQIEEKLRQGYRPRLDDQGNVVLVKVEEEAE